MHICNTLHEAYLLVFFCTPVAAHADTDFEQFPVFTCKQGLFREQAALARTLLARTATITSTTYRVAVTGANIVCHCATGRARWCLTVFCSSPLART